MRKFSKKLFWNIEVWAVQKHVNLVDLVKSFPTNIQYLLLFSIYLQKSASIQPRTSLSMLGGDLEGIWNFEAWENPAQISNPWNLKCEPSGHGWQGCARAKSSQAETRATPATPFASSDRSRSRSMFHQDGKKKLSRMVWRCCLPRLVKQLYIAVQMFWTAGFEAVSKAFLSFYDPPLASSMENDNGWRS